MSQHKRDFISSALKGDTGILESLKELQKGHLGVEDGKESKSMCYEKE